MLVLSRRPGEKIAVGDGVMISVLQVKGDRVIIGIEAPRDMLVLRDELIEAVAQENMAAHQRRSSAQGGQLADLYRYLGQRLADVVVGPKGDTDVPPGN
jgi:carbon storage regulator